MITTTNCQRPQKSTKGQWTLHTSAHWFTTMADVKVHLAGNLGAFIRSID
jgi:hypothetical protein